MEMSRAFWRIKDKVVKIIRKKGETIMSDTIISALGQLFTIQNLIFANIGIFIGIIFGSIPGLNGNLAITVLLPFTFQMDTIPALLLLTAIFFCANFGGSISSILINTPGTNAAAATLIDGYPMCRNGQPQKALDMALVASTIGGLISALCLLFFSPQISKVAIRFGSPEYFALAIFGLSVIASVSGKSIIKGLVSGGMGILLSTVGLDGVSGLVRFSFGNLRLYNGVKMLSTLLGAFTMHGLVVGPKLFVDSGPVVYAVLIGCVISQVIMFLQGKYLLKLFVKITHVPQDLLTAVLVVICCAGAFAISGSEMDVYIMLLFGGIAYLMQKVDFPPVPIVLGMVLGPIAESNLRNALVMSGGSWLIFVQRPICLAFILLTIVLIVLLKKGEAKQRKMAENLIKKNTLLK